MKKKTVPALLLAEGILCTAMTLTSTVDTVNFSDIAAFPFQQIGKLLRTLSLSGGLGNTIAIVVYLALSAIPMVFLMLFRKKRPLQAEDAILPVMSLALLAVLYLMVNPGMIQSTLGPAVDLMGPTLLGGAVYSLLIGYGVLRTLRRFFAAGKEQLQRYLRGLLYAASALFVFGMFGTQLDAFLTTLQNLQQGNTANLGGLTLTYFFLGLQYVVDILPYGADVLICLLTVNLLDQMAASPYGSEASAAAEKLSKTCGQCLAVAVSANMVFDLAQILFAKNLYTVNTSIQFPLLSVIFVLGALLLAQYIKESRQLKEDNDLFI